VTTGLAATTLANKWLDMLAGTAFTAPAGTFIQLHTADPGAAGTTATISGETDRSQVTWSAASAGSKAMASNPGAWATWAGGAVTVSHISAWDAASAGNFLFSGALTTPKAITNGDTFNLTSLSVAFTPIAA
jgi:hypothetical protein